MSKKNVPNAKNSPKLPARANSLKRQIIRQVHGAMVCTIDTHGPIDYERVGSVIARFITNGIFKNMR